MEISPRSQRKVESIVKSASRLFVKFGFHKVTIDNIANESNVSKVTIYKYFNDKQAIYESILMENYLTEFNALVQVINSDMRFEDKINEVVKIRLHKYYDKSIPIYKGDIEMSKNLKDFIEEYSTKMHNERKKLYDFGKQEGFIDPTLSEETLEMYFRVIQNGLVQTFADLSDLSSENLNHLLRILYAGVLGCTKIKKAQ